MLLTMCIMSLGAASLRQKGSDGYGWDGFVTGADYCSDIIEPRHEISNNVVCATSKASDQPAHMRSLIRAFASRFNIICILCY